MIVTMYVALLAIAAMIASAFAVRAAIRNDSRTGDYLMCAGSAALTCFVMLPDMPYQMTAVALLTLADGAVLGWRPSGIAETDLGESTLTTRRK